MGPMLVVAATACAQTLGDVDLCGSGGGGVYTGSAGAFAAATCDDPLPTDLHKQTIDLTVPGHERATCFDGTPGVYYVRHYAETGCEATGTCHPDKWLIWLQGGGQSAEGTSARGESGAFVAEKWCGTTNFQADRLSSAFNTPDLADASGMGILRGGDDGEGLPDAFHGWNVVAIRYCTQDIWSGRATGVPMTANGVDFSGNFTGRFVLGAVLDELEDGVSYGTCDGVEVDLPSLSTADEVVLAGSSAGMHGVVANLDHLATRRFRAPRYGDGDGDPFPRVRGLVDANFEPGQRLDWSAAVRTACDPTSGPCTWAEHMDAVLESTYDASWFDSVTDQSCRRAHLADGTVSVCADPTHLVEHHLETELFVRHSLNDSLIAANAIDNGLALGPDSLAVRTGGAAEGPLSDDDDGDGDVYERIASEISLQLSNLRTGDLDAAEEEKAVPPRVFAQYCSGHEGLTDNVTTFKDAVVGPSGAWTLDEALADWLADVPGETEALLADPNDPSTFDCEP